MKFLAIAMFESFSDLMFESFSDLMSCSDSCCISIMYPVKIIILTGVTDVYMIHMLFVLQSMCETRTASKVICTVVRT